jgi:hypothetical protein
MMYDVWYAGFTGLNAVFDDHLVENAGIFFPYQLVLEILCSIERLD